MANFAPSKLHLAGVVALLPTVLGLVLAPEILNLLPDKWSHILILVGGALQAITKPINAGSTDIVPKEPNSGNGQI